MHIEYDIDIKHGPGLKSLSFTSLAVDWNIIAYNKKYHMHTEAHVICVHISWFTTIISYMLLWFKLKMHFLLS